MSPSASGYRRPTDVLSRRVGSEILVLRPGVSGVVALNGTGVAIWDRLAGDANAAEIADALAADSGELWRAIDDVQEFLATLERLGLVESAATADD